MQKTNVCEKLKFWFKNVMNQRKGQNTIFQGDLNAKMRVMRLQKKFNTLCGEYAPHTQYTKG